MNNRLYVAKVGIAYIIQFSTQCLKNNLQACTSWVDHGYLYTFQVKEVYEPMSIFMGPVRQEIMML
jgi:hypothetical protein